MPTMMIPLSTSLASRPRRRASRVIDEVRERQADGVADAVPVDRDRPELERDGSGVTVIAARPASAASGSIGSGIVAECSPARGAAPGRLSSAAMHATPRPSHARR